MKKCRSGFSLVEMLVVIGILAVLIGASIGGYSAMTRRAEAARGRELVSNVATALNILFQRQGHWPKRLLTESQGNGHLTEEASRCLVENGLMSLMRDSSTKKLIGLDRCGIVTPWATTALKRHSLTDDGLSIRVPSGGTVEDHQLRFALDDDGDGIVEVRLATKTVKVRTNAAVWCWGMNGKEDDYDASMAGRGHADDIYSWSYGQVVRGE